RRILMLIHRGGPRLQFAARDADQAAWHEQPERARAIVDQPLCRVAWQAVLAGQRGHPAVSDPAQAAVSGHPHRPVLAEGEIADPTVPESVACPVGGANLPVDEGRASAVERSNPQAARHRIRREHGDVDRGAEGLPGNLLDLTLRPQTNQAALLIADP